MDKRSKILLFICICLAVSKLLLIGKGTFSFPDEGRYLNSIEAVKSILNHQPREFIIHIFNTQGRPGDALIRTIPASFQLITSSLFGYQVMESRNAFPLQLFNLAIYCLLLFVHYKVSRIVFKETFPALISLLLMSLSINAYIYLRHALPYDESLLIFYYGFYLIMKHSDKAESKPVFMFFLGMLIFFGFIVYPGYFVSFCICFAFLLFFNLDKTNLKIKIKNTLFALWGGAHILVFFELFSHFAKSSYLISTFYLSKSITQGSFEESFTFLFKYLFQVEGALGILLIAGSVIFPILLSLNLKKGGKVRESLIAMLFIVPGSLFLVYAIQGYFFHKMVFYGRLLHQFFPFLIIIASYSLYELSQKIRFNRDFIYIPLVLILLAFHVVSIYQYRQIAYPIDALSAINSKDDIENASFYNETAESIPYGNIFAGDSAHADPGRIIIVNNCYFWPFTDLSKYAIYVPPQEYTLIYSKPHFINFKAYQFEGYSIIARKNLSLANLRIKAYKAEPIN
jgi:hypothetical protein